MVFGAWLLAGCPHAGSKGDVDLARTSDGGNVGDLAGQITGAAGPRALPTFVPLEIASFARPAEEACADNTTVIDVASPATIADALASATSGTTIRIAAGTYVENAGEPTALVISTPNVCLRGTGAVIVQAASSQGYGIEIAADDVVLEGLTVRGFTSAIPIWTGDGATTHRLTIERVTIDQPVGDFREGIVAYGSNQAASGKPPTLDGLTLLDVEVDGTDLGVSCNSGPCQHWWIERSTIRGRRGSGTSGADTFAIEDGRQIALVDSLFTNAEADGIDTKANDVVVLGARVKDVARNGIKLWRGGDVIDSIVDGTGADAALVGDAAGRYRYLHTLVTNHDPSGSQYVGTWGYDDPSGSFQLEFINSIFANNATGGLYAPAAATFAMRHTIWNGTGKLLEIGTTTYAASELASLETDGRGVGNLSSAPQLGTDYTPAAASPAIDQAETTSGLDRDFYGKARKVGNAPDIGPVERP